MSATGNRGMFHHFEYETSLVSRVRTNSYPKHNATNMACTNATLACNPNAMQLSDANMQGITCKHATSIHNAVSYMACTMLMTLVYTMHMELIYTTRWTTHAQCNDQSWDNVAYSMLWTTMAYSMQNGLKPKWMGLSHTQISGQWDEIKVQNTKHACTMH